MWKLKHVVRGILALGGLIVALGPSGAFAQSAGLSKNLSLEEALQQGLQSNRELKASQSNVEAAKLEVQGSKGKYLPSIGLNAEYVHLNEDLSVDLNALRSAMIMSAGAAASAGAGGNPTVGQAVQNQLNSALPSFSMPVQKQDFAMAHLTLAQPLYTGGKITANRTAKEQLFEEAVHKENDTKAQTAVNVIEHYFTAQMAGEVVKIRQESLKSFQEHQRIAQALLRQGQLARAQKMQIDVAVLEAEGDLSKAQRDEKLARKVLANTLNQDETEFVLVTKMKPRSFESLESYTQSARSENSSLKQIKIKKELLGAKESVGKSEFLPTIGLVGSYQLYEKDLNELAPEWFAGVVLKMNLFNGGENKRELDAVRQQKIALGYLENNAQSMVNIGVEKYFSEVLSAQEQYEVATKTKALASESLRLNTAAFKNGFAKSSDVIDSSLTLTGAQLKELKALFDYNLNLAQLLKFSGQQEKILEKFKN